VIGSGAAKRLSAVRWGVAGNIVVAWVLTLPAAASIGALTYGVTRIFGTGALGPVVVSVAILAGSAVLFARRAARGPAVTAPEAG
jgi:PiT family inorganic phosphate transporter